MRRPGDLAELGLSREFMPDGQGSEVDGVAIRIWSFTEEEGEQQLALTILVPENSRGGWAGSAWEIVEQVRRIWEFES